MKNSQKLALLFLALTLLAPTEVEASASPSADPTPWLLIGPEGGFTDAELDTASTAGVATARLGGPALRTATAALVAAAAALLD